MTTNRARPIEDIPFSELCLEGRVRRSTDDETEGTVIDIIRPSVGRFGSSTVRWDDGRSSMFFYEFDTLWKGP